MPGRNAPVPEVFDDLGHAKEVFARRTRLFGSNSSMDVWLDIMRYPLNSPDLTLEVAHCERHADLRPF